MDAATAHTDEGAITAAFARLASAVAVPTSTGPEFLTADAAHASQLPPDPDASRRPEGRVAAYERPLVLLVDADLTAPVSLLPALSHAQSKERPLVLVARGFDARVRETLHANCHTGRVRVLPLTASAEAFAQLSELTDATPLDGQDWLSGWLPASAWGTADAWVSTTDRSWLVLAD